jgi:hypothetical protein
MRLYYANAAYGVTPCNYVRQQINAGYPMRLQSIFQPDIPSKTVSTLLEILEGAVGEDEDAGA